MSIVGGVPVLLLVWVHVCACVDSPAVGGEVPRVDNKGREENG